MRVGMLAEMHPDLDHHGICKLLIQTELAGGLDLNSALNATASKARPSASGKH